MRNFIRQSAKQLYALFLIIIFTPVFAQTYQLDSISFVKYDAVGNEVSQLVHCAKYDRDGKTLETFYHEHNTSGEGFRQRQISTFDQTDNVMKHSVYRWDDAQKNWQETQRSNTIHDKDVLQTYEEYILDEESKWMGLARFEERTDGNTFERIAYTYKNDKWLPRSRLAKQSNATGNPTESIESEWDTTMQDWKPRVKSECQYSNDTLLTEISRYRWFGKWQPEENTVRKYDDSVNLIEEIRREYFNGDWQPTDRTVTSYDGSGRRIADTVFVWNKPENDWLPQTAFQQTFNQDGTEESELSLDWDVALSTWKENVQIVYFYDHQKRLTQNQHFVFDNSGTATGTQYAYKYDEDGDPYQIFVHKLDSKSGNWEDKLKTELYFDKTIIASDIIYYDGFEDYKQRNNKHAVTESRHYKMSEGQYQLVEKRKYYYSIDN